MPLGGGPAERGRLEGTNVPFCRSGSPGRTPLEPGWVSEERRGPAAPSGRAGGRPAEQAAQEARSGPSAANRRGGRTELWTQETMADSRTPRGQGYSVTAQGHTWPGHPGVSGQLRGHRGAMGTPTCASGGSKMCDLRAPLHPQETGVKNSGGCPHRPVRRAGGHGWNVCPGRPGP